MSATNIQLFSSGGYWCCCRCYCCYVNSIMLQQMYKFVLESFVYTKWWYIEFGFSLVCNSCERWHKMHFQHGAFRTYRIYICCLYIQIHMDVNAYVCVSAIFHQHWKSVVCWKIFIRIQPSEVDRKSEWVSENAHKHVNNISIPKASGKKIQQKIDDLVCSFVSDLSSYNIQHSHIPHAYHSINK